ncbi:hypothetical protein GCM10027299_21720 [Larkinella ripae]
MPAPKGNKYALGNQGGRPPMYASATDLAAQIEAYFAYCEGEYHMEEQVRKVKKKDPITKKIVTEEEKVQVEVCDREPERPMWTGLALFLGFATKKSLLDYCEKEEFLFPIARALTVIEREYEELLPFTKGNGVVFALKNFGWVDKMEITGKDGKDLIPALDRLNPDQLEQLRILQEAVKPQ